MARRISSVLGSSLTVAPDGAVGQHAPIPVGGDAWFAWLATASAFRYDGAGGHFTARREAASHGRGGSYWKAYRRSGGTLRRTYLGSAERLTPDRLASAASALAVPAALVPKRPARRPSAVAPAAPGRLRLRLLGSFSLGATGGDRTAIAIASARARSLLAYLALHRDAPQPRQQIAFALWPDASDAQGRNSLRQVLHQLRQAWPDADRFLTARPGSLLLSPAPDLALDVEDYRRAIETARTLGDSGGGPRTALELAAGIYGGDLLPECYDDWIVPERDRLAASQRGLLDQLIAVLGDLHDDPGAIEAARSRLRLDPLDEGTYRTLMRLHSRSGDRAGALRVFHECAAVLERELGVAPDVTTRLAYEEIVREESAPTMVGWGLPGEPAAVAISPTGRPIPLVGRQAEWNAAMACWDRMARGEARVLLLRGEAGIGKSRFAGSLADWARQHGSMSASTRAYAAEGRLAFAPVADWLRSPALAPVVSRLDAGTLRELARLVPELLAVHPGLERPSPRIEDWQRQPFFQALAHAVLLAGQPLVLVLDDLQWCDADTLEWLHFLLRSDRRHRLLVVGTARPDELDENHPLTGLLAALRDADQVTEVDLGRFDLAQTTELAEHVAGQELAPDLAGRIHVETEGNPLFVVEMVRSSVVDDGLAIDAPAPDRRLPPRIQAVIAGRLRRLSTPARELAALAATVGRAFVLDVVREASGVDEEVLVRGVDELVRRQIVRQQGNGTYDFDHDKIREVAYAESSDAQRRYLHRRAAEGLERAYAAALDGVSAQIAAHYANAGLVDRAVIYYQRAAAVEQRVGANLEAIGLLQRAMALLEAGPNRSEPDPRELELQTTLGVSLVATEGYGAPAVLAAYARSRELCELLGRPVSAPILRALALVALAGARIDECRELGDALLLRAEGDGDPVLRVEGHYLRGMSLQAAGGFGAAREALEAALAGYDRERSAEHLARYSQDPAVVCSIRLALDLWLLGEEEASGRRRTESLTLAGTLGHPFSLGYALAWDAILQVHRQDAAQALAQADGAIALDRAHRMPFWQSLATVSRGWALAELGRVAEGIAEMERGLAAFEATGTVIFRPFLLGLLAEQLGRAGEIDRGVALIADALALVEARNERWCEAELWRRQGDLLRRTARPDDASIAYARALEVARSQAAGALETRASSRLADLESGAPIA
jgi:DNA-binding SARP family transcriptional activator/predicted ATPase